VRLYVQACARSRANVGWNRWFKFPSSGRFVGVVENFRFFDLKVYPFADPEAAVAEVKGEGLIKSTGRVYSQDYVVFLRGTGGKSPSSANILIPCVRPRPWTHRYLISNREDKRRLKTGFQCTVIRLSRS
jgi:hypothetical protein